jgi:tetratricopeptide (TPR) repeat protein
VASDVSFTCVCGERFHASSDQAGRKIRCGTCRRIVEIPAAAATPGAEHVKQPGSNPLDGFFAGLQGGGWRRFVRPSWGAVLVALVLLPIAGIALWKWLGRGSSKEYVEYGRHAMEQKDYERAITAFSEALRLDPAYAVAYEERAIACSKRHRWEDAYADDTELIRLQPRNNQAYIHRAEVLVNRGSDLDQLTDMDLAIADCAAALESDPSLAAPYLWRGAARAEKGELKEALADIDKSIFQVPDDPAAYYYRGNIFLGLGEYGKAVGEFNEAISLQPLHARAHARRGLAWLGRGNQAKALQDCTRALTLDAEDPWLYLDRSLVYWHARQPEKAQADADMALLANARHVPTLAWRAFLQCERRSYEHALRECKAADAVNPASGRILALRGLALVFLEHKGKAQANLDRAFRLNAHNPLAYLARAQLWARKSRLDEAVADCNQVIALDPRNAAAYQLRALLRLRQAKPEDAIVDCGKAVDLTPRTAAPLVVRSLAYSKLAQPDKAQADLDAARQIDRKDAYETQAEIFLAMGNPEQAVAHFIEALRLDPRSTGTYLNLARACFQRQDTDQGVKACNRAIDLEPERAGAYALLGFGFVLKAVNDKDKALASAEVVRDLYVQTFQLEADEAIANAGQAIQRDPEDSLAHAVRGCGLLLKGELSKAIASASEAIQLDAEEGLAYAVRGQAYAQNGDKEKAEADLARAAQLNPDYPRVKPGFRSPHVDLPPVPELSRTPTSGLPLVLPEEHGRWQSPMLWAAIALVVVIAGLLYRTRK